MTPSACTSPPAAAIADAEHGEHHDDGAEVLGVELEEVAAPVVLQHAVELRQHGGDDLLGRHREQRGVVPPLLGPPAPRGEYGR